MPFNIELWGPFWGPLRGTGRRLWTMGTSFQSVLGGDGGTAPRRQATSGGTGGPPPPRPQAGQGRRASARASRLSATRTPCPGVHRDN